MRKALTVTILAAALTSFASAADLKVSTTTSKIEFLGTKTGGMHTGGFKEFTGTVAMPGNDLAGATITLDINTNSLFSDTPRLTAHLKSADFFDINKYPKATFKSTAIKAANGTAGTTHEITGDLTLHGVTKSVTVPVKVTSDDKGVTVEGTTTIKQGDFGMTYWNGKLNNDVKVTFVVKAAK